MRSQKLEKGNDLLTIIKKCLTQNFARWYKNKIIECLQTVHAKPWCNGTNFVAMLAINHANQNYFITIAWNHLLSPMEHKKYGGTAVCTGKLSATSWHSRNTSHMDAFFLYLWDNSFLPKDHIVHITWNTFKEIQRCKKPNKIWTVFDCKKRLKRQTCRIFYKNEDIVDIFLLENI